MVYDFASGHFGLCLSTSSGPLPPRNSVSVICRLALFSSPPGRIVSSILGDQDFPVIGTHIFLLKHRAVSVSPLPLLTPRELFDLIVFVLLFLFLFFLVTSSRLSPSFPFDVPRGWRFKIRLLCAFGGVELRVGPMRFLSSFVVSEYPPCNP